FGQGTRELAAPPMNVRDSRQRRRKGRMMLAREGLEARDRALVGRERLVEASEIVVVLRQIHQRTGRAPSLLAFCELQELDGFAIVLERLFERAAPRREVAEHTLELAIELGIAVESPHRRAADAPPPRSSL